MKKYLLLTLMAMFIGDVHATIVSSCDGGYSAKNHGRGRLIVEHGEKKIGSAHIDHAIDGGTFSLDDSILVLFGLPKKLDTHYPQVTHLSVYLVKPEIHLIESAVYGGGVYDATFSEEQKFIVVRNQFGVDVINLKEPKAQSFEATYVPPFKTQQCAKK
ncbi:hypothetical protein [Caballeronia sp. LZ001]|uniref:hypothetical protein n=1 Tax=Caballeronia sp. LZ001 TaxID=3038553 RepID=UPI00285925F0|nr:hypothetical protein [Caballeronia sp. LZ001]MDR5800877.1 hypothetical protein [Caballeronia sp. LZ001]